MRIFVAAHAEPGREGLGEQGRAQAAQLDKQFEQDGVVFDLVVLSPEGPCLETFAQMRHVSAASPKVLVSPLCRRPSEPEAGLVDRMLGLKRLIRDEHAALAAAGTASATVLVLCRKTYASRATGGDLGSACYAVVTPRTGGQ